MNKRLTSALVLSLILVIGTFAHAEWVNVAGSKQAAPRIDVSQDSYTTTTVQINVPGFDLESVTIDGTEYSQIRVPGHWYLLDRAQPELPFITSSLIIADEGTPQVKIIDSVWRDIAAAPVVPSKGNILRTEDPANVSYAFGDIYERGGVFPAAAAELGSPYIMRDYRGVSLRVYPVRWDADRGVLMALESATVQVTTTGSGGVNAIAPHIQTSVDPQFERLYRQGFDNYDGAAKYTMVGVDGPMLVVANDAFMSTIQPFVEWKRQKGLQVDLISTSSVGGTTAGIQGAIDTRFASADGLTYVVLVGDISEVPTYSGTYESADDDTRYANQLGSDLYPDLFVSRISGSTADEITTQINKFIRYERDPDAGGVWYQQAAGLASSEGSPTDEERLSWLHDDLDAYTFTVTDEILQSAGDGATEISASVNAGRSLINYIGHGSGSSWSNPYFSTTNVHALSNGWMTPWIVDVSCSNGDFSMTECFAEAWMRAGDPTQPDGAVAMYSASTSTPWVPPCVMQAEAIDLLVTEQANVIGSLYYHGSMQVMDEYPGDSQGVEQYNIFGDCSLVVRTDTPAPLTVAHGGSVIIGATVFPIDTGVEGSTVALYSNGTLHGVGVTDATGHCDVVLTTPVTTAGNVTLTITGYNQMTHQEEIPAIVPVDVAIDPASIPVGTTTQVTVTLTDPAKAIENVLVKIEGYGVSGLEFTTGSDGIAVFDVTPQFGETLQVIGREVGESYDMFSEPLPVTGALTLTDAAISAEVASIGLSGSLAVGFAGDVTGSATETDLTLVLSGAGVDVSGSDAGSSVTVAATPTEAGTVSVALMKTGYDVVLQDIDAVAALGQLSGNVTSTIMDPIADARVQIFAEGEGVGDTPLYDLLSDSNGDWTVGEDLAVGNYELHVTKFGYLTHDETFFVMYGANSALAVLEDAPAGDLIGAVTALDGGAPIEARVRVYRSDNAELMADVTADAGTGNYIVEDLPYYDYNILVTATGFIPQTVLVTVTGDFTVQNFALEATIGNILVIDDDTRPGLLVGTKRDKNNNLLAYGYVRSDDRSADQISTDLTNFGYNVTVVENGSYDTGDWAAYDLIVVASGGNTSTLNGTLTTDLRDYALLGGRLLIEGGEIAYNHQSDTNFCADVLHILDWHADSSGNVTVQDPTHYVMSVPNAITGPLALTYSGYGDSDAVSLATDAEWVGSWSTQATRGSVVCYDPTPAPQAGQMVYFTFNYLALDSGVRGDLLQNAVIWLLNQEIGESGLSGTVTLANQSDHSGILVTLMPVGLSVTTGSDGTYSFSDLTAGDYQIIASKDGYVTSTADVTLGESETVTDVDLELAVSYVAEICDTPAVSIPDNNATGVTVTMDVAQSFDIADIEVSLAITHTYIGDLIVTLTSPLGTEVVLHNRTGGTTENIITTYPTLTAPAEDIDVLLGENMAGTWQLTVSDNAGVDTGTIDEWCLYLTYEDPMSPVEDGGLPGVLTLDANFPNPFNPMTNIRFALPNAQLVDLAVYDLQGRRVATLVSETMSAGAHVVTWTGRDELGRAVSSGTYFYRLTTGEEILTGKMLLMK